MQYTKIVRWQSLDTKSLQIFQHLARSLHFGKTANAYHMSPSTLSRLVQRMEQQMSCQLLIRDNRSVLLTDNGSKLLDYADQQIERWQSLTNNIAEQSDHLTGKLHIFCSVTAAYSHLPALLDRFRQQHPSVEIILTTGDAANAISNVQESLADIAIAAKPHQISSNLLFSSIAEIPLAIIAPLLSTKIRQQLRQTKINWSKIPIILPEHGPARRRFDRWFSLKQQGRPYIYATVSGHEALVSMVALGCGVGISPEVVVENSPVRNRVEYLANVGEIEPFTLGICCQKQKFTQPVIKAFFDAID